MKQTWIATAVVLAWVSACSTPTTSPPPPARRGFRLMVTRDDGAGTRSMITIKSSSEAAVFPSLSETVVRPGAIQSKEGTPRSDDLVELQHELLDPEMSTVSSSPPAAGPTTRVQLSGRDTLDVTVATPLPPPIARLVATVDRVAAAATMGSNGVTWSPGRDPAR